MGMGKRSRLLPHAVRDRFKYEIAEDLGIAAEVAERGWADLPSREVGRIGGRIGGRMVRVLVRQAEEELRRQS
jgi:small acid-soluble spore protein F (minor alpha/beta-type SASP)